MFTSNSRILDLLADAVRRELAQPGQWAWVWFQGMTAEERLGFDLFLVRMKDPLAEVAGSPESRFRTRVQRMAAQERERRAAK